MISSQNSKINILIVGATGLLGSLITKYSLTTPNLIVNVLIRDPQKNKELIDQVEKAGGRVLQGDITNPESLKGVTKGMHTIIFSLPMMGEKINIDGQLALIKDAVENGVERIVPSVFTANFANFSPEEIAQFPIITNKLQVQEQLKKIPIKTLTISTGIFPETFFGSIQDKDFGYWGDVNHRFDFTTYDDTAKFTAAAVSRKDLTGDLVYVSNDLTFNELADIYNRVRGTNVRSKYLGSLEDLRREAEELEKQGDENAFMMKFFTFSFDNRSKFEKVYNSEFPEVKRTSMEEYFRENPNVKLSSL